MALSLRQASVLVIDDFQGMRTMLRDFVRSMGVSRIGTASNGVDAIAQLGMARYDIVICDYNLGPGPNGQQVLEEARLKNLVGVATVWTMVTAETMPEMVMGTAEVRPDDYVLKPINQVVLETRLSRLLTRKHALAPIEAAVKAGDYVEAIAQCDRQLQVNGAYPHDILRLKSDLMLALADYKGAGAVFDAVLASRQTPWAQTGKGKIHFHQQRFERAKEVFQTVRQQNLAYVDASDWLAKTCTQIGELEEAESVLLEATRISPNSPIRQKKLGETAYRNGSLEVAQAAFEKTIRISEYSPYKSLAAYTSLAQVQVDRNVPHEALKTLALSKQAFKYDTDAAIHATAAECAVYHQMGQTDRARAEMRNLEKLLPKASSQISAEARLAVAKSMLVLEREDKARALLQEVVRNNHENTEMLRSIEDLFEAQGMPAQGQALIAESIAEVVDINNRGVTLAQEGDLLAGANLLRSACAQLPHNEVMLTNLCGLLIALLDKEGRSQKVANEARELLDRVRQINPDSRKYHSYNAALIRAMGGR